MTAKNLTLHYAPRSRALTALWLLEELGEPYGLASFDMTSGAHKSPEFLAMNPMGKVPVIVHGETPVSELGAIAIYLADNFSSSGLAPAPTAPLRAAFLRWVFFSSAIMEPCLGEKFFNWNLPAVSMAWGSFEHMMATLEPALETGPYLLGDQFSAADVLVGSTLRFGHMFGAIPNEGVTKSYAERLAARGAFKRASEIEAREGERFPAPPSD